MNSKVLSSLILLLGVSLCIMAEPEPAEDGKYKPKKYSNSGKYVPSSSNAGRYVHRTYPYMHVHDDREKGIYVHIPNPYDGGYGPYDGDQNLYRYQFDNKGDYSLYTVSKDPFDNQVYDIPRPEVLLQYGFPEYSPKTKRSIASNDHKIIPSLTKILPIDSLNGNQDTKTLLDSQTTTTTTPRPRTTYEDEGKWRILHQKEEKGHKKYDYLYLTENGIYAEEQARVNDNEESRGTTGKGYYEYTGDDGELYRVYYQTGEVGFVPMADHIPYQLKKAIAYIAAKDKAKLQEKLQAKKYKN